jgi:ubiquitin-conjugating enzyme E2 variant
VDSRAHLTRPSQYVCASQPRGLSIQHSRFLCSLISAPHRAARNFKLLDELEDAEKSAKGGADISLGLQRADDTMMRDWQASIFQAPGGLAEPRIWFMTIVAGDAYPAAPPTIKFTSKINADFVDARGNVLPGKVPYLAGWNSGKSMYGALQEIKNLIYRAPRSQPPEEATY